MFPETRDRAASAHSRPQLASGTEDRRAHARHTGLALGDALGPSQVPCPLQLARFCCEGTFHVLSPREQHLVAAVERAGSTAPTGTVSLKPLPARSTAA